MNGEETIERLRTHLQQLARGNPEPFFDFMANDVVYEIPSPANAPWCGVHRGKDAVRAVIGNQHVEIQLFDVIDVFGSGDRCAILIHERYVVRRTGRTVDQTVVIVCRIENEEIVQMQEFSDTDQVRAAFESE